MSILEQRGRFFNNDGISGFMFKVNGRLVGVYLTEKVTKTVLYCGDKYRTCYSNDITRGLDLVDDPIEGNLTMVVYCDTNKIDELFGTFVLV